jgi:predicted lipoprotein with Yx(FWY)xxD motif
MAIRRWAPVALVALASLVLAGCGSSSKKVASSATTAASTTTTAAASAISVATDAKLGQILVDASGRTLYHFTKDAGTTIACTDTCATTWPPLLAPPDPLPATGPGGGTLATVARPDGGTQVTYNGATLYTYSGDSKAGDTNGQGIGGLWFVVAPKAAAQSTATTAGAAGGTATTARATATTARPTTKATTAPTNPPATQPPATQPPATSPPTTMHTVTTTCAYPPCY